MAFALRFAARSDVGLLRDGNEDSGYAGPRLLAVADGMGGAVAGEVASSVVVASLAALDEDTPGPDLLDRLSRAVTQANEQLRMMIKADPSLDGMGTTLTALLHAGSRLGLVHVGDSRCYLLRDGELTQITKDHTWVQALIDDGRITAEEADHHPQRALILRVLDGREHVELDLSVREARVGDRYLLCSDGLSGVVSEQTLRDTLARAASPAEACDKLVELALRGGGPDNITCIVADVVDADAAPSDIPEVVGAVAETREERRGGSSFPAARAAALRASSGTLRRAAHPAAHARPRRRWVLRAVLVLLVLALFGGGVTGAYAWSQRQYYVGSDNGQVVIYRGVDQKLAGVSLSRVHERLPLRVDELPAFARQRVVDESIAARDLADAHRIVAALRAQAESCPRERPAMTAQGTNGAGGRREPVGSVASATPTATSAPGGATPTSTDARPPASARAGERTSAPPSTPNQRTTAPVSPTGAAPSPTLGPPSVDCSGGTP